MLTPTGDLTQVAHPRSHRRGSPALPYGFPFPSHRRRTAIPGARLPSRLNALPALPLAGGCLRDVPSGSDDRFSGWETLCVHRELISAMVSCYFS